MEILGSRTFSNNFDKTGSKLIGPYNSASFADLLGSWTIIICAIFHWDEKKPHLRII